MLTFTPYVLILCMNTAVIETLLTIVPTIIIKISFVSLLYFVSITVVD